MLYTIKYKKYILKFLSISWISIVWFVLDSTSGQLLLICQMPLDFNHLQWLDCLGYDSRLLWMIRKNSKHFSAQ